MTTLTRTITPWSRRKLLTAAASVVAVVVCVLAGLGLAIRSTATSSAPEPVVPSATSLPTGEAERRDVLAAEPMLQVAGSDATAGVPAATPLPAITIPQPGRIGEARVPSGFPHTPTGAIGQLAAIEVSVLTEMNIARTNEIHQAWTVPGGVPVEQWRMTHNVQAFLAAAGMGQALEPGSWVEVTPVAAQVKASDGPDWVVACVLVDVRAMVRTEARMAYGYCERMQWDGTRWLIAPGAPPAEAPSTWPGTDLAFEAGWQTWPASNR